MILVLLLHFFTTLSFGEIHPLKLKTLWSVDSSQIASRMDLSGLSTDGTSLFTVSDLSDLNDIYRIDLQESGAVLRIHQKLDADWMQQYAQENAQYGRLDMEGIAWCAGQFYIVNEHKRSVLRIGSGAYQELVPDWENFHKGRMNPFSGVENAGLEAVACNGTDLYLFNERQFRMGYVYSLTSEKLTHQFDIPSGPNLPRFLVEQWMYADFAGAHYEDGVLYLLERNSHQIIKVDPKSYQVLARYDFSQWEKGLFTTKDPYGLAEGLTIFNGSFFVVLDNNLDLRSKDQSPMPYLLELTAEH